MNLVRPLADMEIACVLRECWGGEENSSHGGPDLTKAGFLSNVKASGKGCGSCSQSCSLSLNGVG